MQTQVSRALESPPPCAASCGPVSPRSVGKSFPVSSCCPVPVPPLPPCCTVSLLISPGCRSFGSFIHSAPFSLDLDTLAAFLHRDAQNRTQFCPLHYHKIVAITGNHTLSKNRRLFLFWTRLRDRKFSMRNNKIFPPRLLMTVVFQAPVTLL